MGPPPVCPGWVGAVDPGSPSRDRRPPGAARGATGPRLARHRRVIPGGRSGRALCGGPPAGERRLRWKPGSGRREQGRPRGGHLVGRVCAPGSPPGGPGPSPGDRCGVGPGARLRSCSSDPGARARSARRPATFCRSACHRPGSRASSWCPRAVTQAAGSSRGRAPSGRSGRPPGGPERPADAFSSHASPLAQGIPPDGRHDPWNHHPRAP